jgi:ubiquinone/menaquinone biosynthesis C-methylase UbiE
LLKVLGQFSDSLFPLHSLCWKLKELFAKVNPRMALDGKCSKEPSCIGKTFTASKGSSHCRVCGDGTLILLEKKKNINGSLEEILICDCCLVLVNAGAFEHDIALQVHASETFYKLDQEVLTHLEEHINEQQRLLAYVLPSLGKVSGKVMLEIGCGRGLMLIAARRLGFRRAIGIDPNIETFNELAKHVTLDSGVAVYRDLLDVSEKVDCIVMWHALEHISEPREFLKSLVKFVNDKALIFLQVPQYTQRYVCSTHYYFYNEPSMHRLMADGGFEILEIGYDIDNEFMTVVARYVSK